jgi:HEAT repeat protein
MARCPNCGFDFSTFEKAPYEEKLMRAVLHPVPEIRATAISILGRIGTARTLPVLEKILHEEKKDIYVLLEVLQALAMIEDPAAGELLQTATQHLYPVVQRRAKELLEWHRKRSD